MAAALLARPSRLLAGSARYDLLVKGGRVIDPSRRLNATCDVAIAGGRIAGVAPRIAGKARLTLDAHGQLIVPGLIDIHTHAAWHPEGPKRLLAEGVTGWIDGGSQGADRIEEVVAVARSAPQPCGVLINIGRAGILTEGGDTIDLALADVTLAKEAIAKHRDFIVGVKARLSPDNTSNDVEVLKRAQEVASAFDLPVMIHMGQTVAPLPTLLNLLKRGDIVTHMFAPPPNAIFDDTGRILPEVLAARGRGVWFDVGNGRRRHLRWDTVEIIMKSGFHPDSISSDWTVDSRNSGVINLANCMSKFFTFGMTVDEAIACTTRNPARMFPIFKDYGTLNVGAPANVAVLELREGDFEFVDNYDQKLVGHRRFFPSTTILGGNLIAQA